MGMGFLSSIKILEFVLINGDAMNIKDVKDFLYEIEVLGFSVFKNVVSTQLLERLRRDVEKHENRCKISLFVLFEFVTPPAHAVAMLVVC